jgi:hemolysin III
MEQAHRYSAGEEIANAVTHGIGAALGVAALVLLVLRASETGDVTKIVSATVFGASLVILYLFSTLYHAVSSRRAKRVFRILDHAGIYLLIAGSYTPFALVALEPPAGRLLLGVIWALAIVGISAEAFWVDRPRWLSAALFIGIGWMAVTVMRPLVEALPTTAVWLLVCGGLAYTGGAVFYVMKRVPYMHAVWHGWVIAGSACHVLAVLLFVL